jgi:hypothetical protein
MEADKRERLFCQIPYIGVALCLCGLLAYPFPAVREYFFVNNRLSAGFGYANTLALYLLLGIIVLAGKKKLTYRSYLWLTILLLGIFATGSRIVLVLTALTLCCIVVQRREKAFLVYVLVLFVAAGLAVAVFGQRFALLGRVRTISLKESTLAGRILYARDALALLWKYPLGMGYMGYYYMENSVQSGVYSVQYVHQDILQAGLDFGWIPMLLYLVLLVKTFLSKAVGRSKKMMLAVITLHGLLDFDLAYGAMLCIVYLLMNEALLSGRWKQKTLRLRGTAAAGLAVLGCFAVYMSVPLLARYSNHPQLARAWYRYDTEANLVLLSEASDENTVEELADQILAQNDTCALAYYGKAMAADIREDYRSMIRYQKQSIKRNYFDYEEYYNFAVMLYDGLQYAYQQGDDKIYQLCEKELKSIPDAMEQAKKKQSALGKTIQDQPQLKITDELQEILSVVE